MAKKTATRKKATSKGGAPIPSIDEALKTLPAPITTLIDEKKLNKLLDADIAYKEEIDSVVGQLREEIKNNVDKNHLHKGAYADVKKYDRIKSPEKLAEHFLTLIAYMKMRGLLERINSVPRLDLEEPAPPAPPAAKTTKPGPKFGETVKSLAEAAGAGATGKHPLEE